MTTNEATGREVAIQDRTATAAAAVTPGAPSPAHDHTVAYQVPSVGDLLPSPAQFDMMMRIAGTVTVAGTGKNSMVPDNITTPEAALAVMLAGAELGFPPFAALRQVFIVNGKTELMTEGKLALMRQRDPSLQIEWHRGARRGVLEDGTEGAEATLWRGGKPVVRIRYDATDKARAHQGQRRAGARKWIPMLGRDGKQEVYPAGHERAGQGKVKINPQFDESAPGVWEDDEDSPWTKFAPDMYEWAVTKRLERFGASDLVNLAPLQVVEALPGAWTAEEDRAIPEAPLTQLSAAIVNGEVDPARVVSETAIPEPDSDDPDEPPADDDDEHGDDPDEDPNAPRETGEDSPAPDASLDIDLDDLPAADVRELEAEPTAEDLEAATAEARQKLYDAALRIQRAGTMSPTEYGNVIRSLGNKYTPESGKLATSVMTLQQARDALAELLEAAGEAPPPEVATS